MRIPKRRRADDVRNVFGKKNLRSRRERERMGKWMLDRGEREREDGKWMKEDGKKSQDESHLPILSQSESHFNPSYFVSFSPPSLFILSLLIVYLFLISLSLPISPSFLHQRTFIDRRSSTHQVSPHLLLPPLHSLF